jgi:hypothetical protein
MLGLLRDEPTFSERFIAYMLARNIRIEADLVDHLFNSSEKRLARALLLLARYRPSWATPSRSNCWEGRGATALRVRRMLSDGAGGARTTTTVSGTCSPLGARTADGSSRQTPDNRVTLIGCRRWVRCPGATGCPE